MGWERQLLTTAEVFSVARSRGGVAREAKLLSLWDKLKVLYNCILSGKKGIYISNKVASTSNQ